MVKRANVPDKFNDASESVTRLQITIVVVRLGGGLPNQDLLASNLSSAE